MKELEIASQYFECWNNRDLIGLKNLFTSDVVLKDWDIDVSGIEGVIEATKNIFSLAPSISIVVKQALSGSNKVMVEIEVQIDDKNSIEVVDVLTLKSNKISSIKAYKI